MENRAFGVLAALLLLCCGYSLPANSEPLRVLYAEPFQAQSVSAPGAQKAGPANLRVRGFGRTFELELEDNSRLLRATSAQTRERIGAIQLLKGTIRDAPGSWVRLTLSGGRYSGAFWDGSELYAIAQRETLDAALLAPMQPATTAIYRLSDTQGGLLQGTCGVGPGERATSSPLAKFKSLMHELRAVADSAFAAAPREIEVSMVADFELTSRLGSATASSLLEKANIVDGIFSSQVGVSTIPTDFITFATDTDPLTSSEPSTLLAQFGEYRSNTPVVRNRGLAHLITGRGLVGSTIGIAYLGSLCEAQAGSSLSESSNFVDSALIMAHELGHNFGAPHDAQSGSACATAPLGFIMAPELNGSTSFSSCSVQQMQPHIAAASCVITSRNRDVAVSVPADTIQTIVDEQFDVPIDLLSVGDTDAANIIVTINTPFAMTVLSVSLPGTDCTIESDEIRCELPTLAAGASTRLMLRASHRSASPFAIGVHVLSSNDVNSSNDNAVIRGESVGHRALLITPVSLPSSVTLGDPFEVEFEIAAVGNEALSNVFTQLSLFRSRTVAATIDGGTCDTTTNGEIILLCTIGSVTPGTPRRLRAQLICDAVGPTFGQASAHEPSGGPTAIAQFTIPTLAAHDIELWTDQQDKLTPVGVDAVWPIEVRSAGAYPVDDVHIQLNFPAGPNASLQGPLAALCTRTSSELIDCDLGTLAAGAVIAGQLRYRSDVPRSISFMAHVVPVLSDDDSGNDVLGLDLRVRVASEISLTAPATRSVLELQPATLQATIGASGALDSEDVSVNVALPAGFSISSARLAQSPCTLHASTPNLATCTRSQLQPDEAVALTIDYQADSPGVYTGSITVTARDDFDTSNNTGSVTFQVAPAVSGSLQGPPPAVFPTAVATDVVYTLRTNKYALTDAQLNFTWFGVLDQFVATAAGAVCSASPGGHSCSFGTVAANSAIPVTVRLRSPSANAVSIHAVLTSPAETVPTDNAAFVSYTFVQPGDMTVSTGQPALSAISGRRLELIFDVNVLATAIDPYLELGFDPARIQDASLLVGGGLCTWGTQPVRCQLVSQLGPGSNRNNFSFVPRTTGPLQITLRVGARNDFNAANDQLTVTVNVTDPAPPSPPPPAPSSSGGGGGGGSMSWPFGSALVLMWAMMWHHRRPRRRARH